ncbi:hypothetical protein EDD18DRAFT_1102298 [Armillaria luteobubalina]|uniref:Uncharacterized protein n=1 Tax=Armillaria luteobubalina TaxID=153913 RepID=A0AA39URD7_9AGAR|nr:hypothetical protein EDD18DRAFT_1102298 [Armillaria luteobubalina]
MVPPTFAALEVLFHQTLQIPPLFSILNLWTSQRDSEFEVRLTCGESRCVDANPEQGWDYEYRSSDIIQTETTSRKISCIGSIRKLNRPTDFVAKAKVPWYCTKQLPGEFRFRYFPAGWSPQVVEKPGSLLFNFNVLGNTLSAEVQTATNPLHTLDPRKDILKLQMTDDPQRFDSSQHLKQHFLRNSGQSIGVPVTAGSLK